MLALTTVGKKEETGGKNRRPLIIALISLGAIVLLSLLLLFGRQFVGKAVATGAGELTAEQEGTVSFNVDVGTSKAASFVMEVTSEQVALCDGSTVLPTISNILYGPSCFGCEPSCTTQGALRLEGAWFNLQADPPSGEVKLADLTFTVPTMQNVVFKFNELQVLDDNSVNQITATPDITLAVTGGVAAACGDNDDVCTQGSSQSCITGGYAGTQSCNSDCTSFGACATTESCGDGIKNGLEACDGSQFGTADCASVVGAGSTGNLACTASCTIDSSGCTGVPQCTEAYCKSTYGLILPAECSCPAVDSAAVNTFCSNADNTDTCQTMCSDLNLCPDGTGGYTVNINGDKDDNGNDIIDGRDAFIILKIAEALVRAECGEAAQQPCGPFSGTYTCDSGDFRVEGYKGFTFAGQTCAQLTNTADYISGG